MEDFLDHHRRAMSVQRERNSMARESMLRELSVSREIRASVPRELRASIPRDVRTSVPREITTLPNRDIRSMSRDIRASVAREFESATRDLPPVEEGKEMNVVKET